MSSWFRYGQTRPAAAVRLFCFHHAGGGASSYSAWAILAPPDVEVCPIQLPGRENRLSEDAFSDMEALAARLADALETELDRPYALFGHSMGARVAYAAAAELQERGLPAPSALIVSASPAPHHLLARRDMHLLPDDRLAEELAALGGLPEVIRRSDEVMGPMLALARADLSVLETWRPRPGVQVPAAILALGGEDDRLAPRAALESWAPLAAGGFRLRLFPGGHFYLRAHRHAVLAEVCAALLPGRGTG